MPTSVIVNGSCFVHLQMDPNPETQLSIFQKVSLATHFLHVLLWLAMLQLKQAKFKTNLKSVLNFVCRYAFLFDKALLVCKKRSGESMELKELVNLQQFQLRDEPSGDKEYKKVFLHTVFFSVLTLFWVICAFVSIMLSHWVSVLAYVCIVDTYLLADGFVWSGWIRSVLQDTWTEEEMARTVRDGSVSNVSATPFSR